VLRLVERGNSLRATASTNCNEHSSRSHAILTLYVESRFVGGTVGTGGTRGGGASGDKGATSGTGAAGIGEVG